METRIVRARERLIVIDYVVSLAEHQARTGQRRPSLEEYLIRLEKELTKCQTADIATLAEKS